MSRWFTYAGIAVGGLFVLSATVACGAIYVESHRVPADVRAVSVPAERFKDRLLGPNFHKEWKTMVKQAIIDTSSRIEVIDAKALWDRALPEQGLRTEAALDRLLADGDRRGQAHRLPHQLVFTRPWQAWIVDMENRDLWRQLTAQFSYDESSKRCMLHPALFVIGVEVCSERDYEGSAADSLGEQIAHMLLQAYPSQTVRVAVLGME